VITVNWLGIETNDVVSLDLAGPVKKIHLTDKTLTACALIIATGASPRKLGIPGEVKLFGKGVSTCATCDGPFYRDQVVVAAGGGDTAVQESLFLTKFARKVYLVHRRNQLRATKILQERAFINDKLEIIWDSALTEIRGTSSVEQYIESGKAQSVKNIGLSDTNKKASVAAGANKQTMAAANDWF